MSNQPLPAHLVGWAYHFSNGAALGIMFLAMAPRPARHRHGRGRSPRPWSAPVTV